MKGQIFTMDLFLSLMVMVLIISMAVVIIDEHIDGLYERATEVKLQSIAMDTASLHYYTGKTDNLTKITGETCIHAVRGTASNEVIGIACE